MDLLLQGAKVFIAGSRAGLGAAAARQFSREGAWVAINGRHPDLLQQTADSIRAETDGRVVAVAGDVSQRGEATRVVEAAAQQLGGLDVLITNSGGPPAGEFANFNLDNWEAAYHLLLGSTIEMVQAALPYLRQSQQAAILAVTSLTVKQPTDNLILSNVLRAGVAALMKSLANELGPEGIRVNAILPGWTATERVGVLINARAAVANSTPEAEHANRVAAIPLRRMGTPEEFANVAVFMCSPVAGFMHGAMLPVDGGEIRATL